MAQATRYYGKDLVTCSIDGTDYVNYVRSVDIEFQTIEAYVTCLKDPATVRRNARGDWRIRVELAADPDAKTTLAATLAKAGLDTADDMNFSIQTGSSGLTYAGTSAAILLEGGHGISDGGQTITIAIACDGTMMTIS